MPVTKALSSIINAKQFTGADSPQNPGSLVTYTYGPATSTAGQTVINLGFSVPLISGANVNFILIVDGKWLQVGASNDYQFTNVQANGTSSQVTLNFSLTAGLNISATLLGVLVPSAASTSILTINSEISTINSEISTINSEISTIDTTIALQPTISTVTATTFSGGFSAASSGNYTPPTGVKYIKLRMVGGGGGGAGSGTSAGTAAGSGGNTTFGALTAGGGSAGGYGTTGAGGSGAGGNLLNIAGGYGQLGAGLNAATGVSFPGGIGGSSAFSGAGGSQNDNAGAGHAAASNSGSGGGGGSGTFNTVNSRGGAGGSAGGYVEHIYMPPSGTYSFNVGSAGSAGGAGASGAAGGAGASGIIIIEEYYI